MLHHLRKTNRNRVSVRRILLFACCLWLFPSTLCADAVWLKGGKVVRGKIVGETEHRLTIKTGESSSTSFLKREIRWVERDELPGWNLVKVEQVLGGEMVLLDNGERLRYIGIEVPKDLGYTVVREATAFNKYLVEGKVVGLELDVQHTDRAGNILGYVFIGDVFVNEELAKLGYAKARREGQNIKYEDRLLEAQNEARKDQRGLWKELSPEEEESEDKGFIASKKSRFYHRRSCPDARNIPEAELLSFESRQAAIDSGRVGCNTCAP